MARARRLRYTDCGLNHHYHRYPNMGRVAIITDSAPCRPPALRERYAIETVPLHYHFGERSYADNVSLTADEFYALLKASRRLPTTASPGPGVFLEAARPADCGGTLDDAIAAAQDLVPRVHMIGMLDTLDYLAKGGRVPRLTAWVSSVSPMK